MVAFVFGDLRSVSEESLSKGHVAAFSWVRSPCVLSTYHNSLCKDIGHALRRVKQREVGGLHCSSLCMPRTSQPPHHS